MAFEASVWLCAKCGITPGHVLHPEQIADGAYFTGRGTHIGVVAVRQGVSKNGYNVNEIHVAQPVDLCLQYDFIVYENNDSIKIVNRVTTTEYVNAESTRIQFVIDYWHTYAGWVEWGKTWCYISRSHVKKYTNISDYLLEEPINPPKETTRLVNQSDFFTPWKTWHAGWSYMVYASVDENGNGNSPNIKLQNVAGGMFYGQIKTYGLGNEDLLTQDLKKYVNQQQWFQTAVSPMIANTQKVVLLPWVATNPAQTSPTAGAIIELQTPDVIYPKALAPQFVKVRLVALSSGNSLDFDCTYGLNTGQTVTFTGDFFVVGGAVPMGGFSLGVRQVDNENSTVVTKALTITQSPYPEVPFNMYLPSHASVGGIIESGIRTAQKGMNDGAKAFNLAGEVESGGAAAYQAGINTMADFGLGTFRTADMAINGVGSESYTKLTGANPNMAWGYQMYDWEIIVEKPTTEGFEVLHSFFNTRGYSLCKRMIIDIGVNANFTYVQTGGYPTFSGNAPQVALDAIARILEAGVTIWKVPIGSTEEAN